jgi:hypothetical protein
MVQGCSLRCVGPALSIAIVNDHLDTVQTACRTADSRRADCVRAGRRCRKLRVFCRHEHCPRPCGTSRRRAGRVCAAECKGAGQRRRQHLRRHRTAPRNARWHGRHCCLLLEARVPWRMRSMENGARRFTVRWADAMTSNTASASWDCCWVPKQTRTPHGGGLDQC